MNASILGMVTGPKVFYRPTFHQTMPPILRIFDYVNRVKLINKFLIHCNHAMDPVIKMHTYRCVNENTCKFKAGAKRNKGIY